MAYHHHTSKGPDVYQRVTDSIIASIENGAGEWQCPWSQSQAMPVNATTKRRYNGINVVMLWCISGENGWPHGWASYKQWRDAGAQVRKGERGTTVVFYKSLDRDRRDGSGAVVTGDNGEPEVDRIRIARAFTVFNAAQVDGYEPEPVPERPLFERIENAERFVTNTGAIVRHGGEQAFYRPSADLIKMPDREGFTGTETSTAQEGYYGTILHELTHWTGPEKRCARDLGKRFGREAYAAEELVAELGAAFLCSELGITAQPRPDHAQYIAHWLAILKGDKRAIFTAAAKAQQAVEYLASLQTAVPVAA